MDRDKTNPGKPVPLARITIPIGPADSTSAKRRVHAGPPFSVRTLQANGFPNVQTLMRANPQRIAFKVACVIAGQVIISPAAPANAQDGLFVVAPAVVEFCLDTHGIIVQSEWLLWTMGGATFTTVIESFW